MTKELLPGLLAVEVPEGGCEIRMTETGLEYRASAGTWFVIIMCGYSILGIGTADKITEQEWAGVVEAHTVKYTDGTESTGWKDYEYDENEPIPELHDAAFLPFTLAGESGLSLLKLHNLNPSTTILLISKKYIYGK